MKILELKHITKRFGGLTANDGIDLDIEKGEVHCLLGENGAGKTTLMKILFGMVAADTGQIVHDGRPVSLHNPHAALRRGIGMIHQHFMLVDRLSVADNLVAGCEPRRGFLLDSKKSESQVLSAAETYGLRVNPKEKVENLSVGEQQRLEILKALYRGADILILDEPTSVLTPQEVRDLFSIIRNLTAAGKTILFITHKLKETMAIADRITVLRGGKKIATVRKDDTDPGRLAKMMIGREVFLRPAKPEKPPGAVVFEAKQVCASHPLRHLRLKNITLSIRAGEILGIAGVEGNGQLELEEAIMGLRPIDSGGIVLNGRPIQRLRTAERRAAGMVHIPSDRVRRGMIGSQSVENNLILGVHRKKPYAKRGVLQRPEIESYCRRVIEAFGIRCRGGRDTAGTLSGGNQQKLILGRELSQEPVFILAAHPTRGVDIGAVESIHRLLLEKRNENKAILLISAELDELLSLSDRIAVLYEGEVVAEGDGFTEEALGLLMTGQTPREATPRDAAR